MCDSPEELEPVHHSHTQPRNEKGCFMREVPEGLAPIELEEDAPAVEFGANYKTSQIYSRGFEFAFMSLIGGVYRQACTFVYCKDFLHDAVWAYVNQTHWEIWNFHYSYQKDTPLDMNHCVFAFRNTAYKGKEEEFHNHRPACLEFLNGAEEKLGFQPSRIYKIPYDEGPCWLIVGDKGWQHAPPMVGLYTLFIRVGFMHALGETYEQTLEKAKNGQIKIGDGGPRQDYAGCKDCSYISQAWSGIQVLLRHSLAIFHPEMKDNYPADLPKRGPSLHDQYGPVNFSRKSPQKAMPYWYREEIWNNREEK